MLWVSIPFKRESTCEQMLIAIGFKFDTYLFQFPSNGKARVNFIVRTRLKSQPILFQFPSNGKARVNGLCRKLKTILPGFVSIPFKRESTCERERA